MFRSLLVPVDGSAFGEHALPLAMSIARRAGAKLQLLHVHRPLSVLYMEGAGAVNDDLEAVLRKHGEDYLTDVAARVQKASGLPVASSLVDGEVAPAIQETVARAAVDLVVLTTHARGPMGRFWLGSVADELVRRLVVPTVLVRPTEEGSDLGREPALKHILLPLDGSALAEQILGPAADLAELMAADLTLLRVIHPVLPMKGTFPGATVQQRVQALITQIEEAQEALRQEALRYLEGVAQRLRGRSLGVRTKVVAEHQPATAVLHEAAVSSPDTDLIALETHGRRGLSRLLLGSVADKVLRGSLVPVLVQRPAHPSGKDEH
jgi:nucleotide-binding universal stress UspA family protein